MKKDEEIEQLIQQVYKDRLLIDKKEVQTLLGISAATLNRLIQAAQIPYIKISDKPNAQVKFLLPELAEWLRSKQIRAI